MSSSEDISRKEIDELAQKLATDSGQGVRVSVINIKLVTSVASPNSQEK